MGGLSDAELFRLWGPACSGRHATVNLFGEGRVTVQPALIDAVRALSACYEESNYRTRRQDTGAYVCRDKVTRPGQKSVHALAAAVDTNWQTNPYGQRLVSDRPHAMNAAIAALRTRSGAPVWSWGGDWSGNKDAMHNQAACSPRDIASGIEPSTLPSSAPVQPPPAGVPARPTIRLGDVGRAAEILNYELAAVTGQTMSHPTNRFDWSAVKALQDLERMFGTEWGDCTVTTPELWAGVDFLAIGRGALVTA